MNRSSLVFVTLLLSCGVAAANQEIAKVQVRPQDQPRRDFACANPARPSSAEVERLLSINDRTQTDELTHALMGAVTEACNAGVPSIAVQRAVTGHSLTWKAARSFDANVALR